jgi:hypothetical protein
MKTYYNIGCIALVISVLMISLAQTSKKTEFPEKEFMTLTAVSEVNSTALKVYLSVKGQDYTQEVFTGTAQNVKGIFDYNAVMSILSEYNRAGWEVTTNNFTTQKNATGETQCYNYFFLTRQKGDTKKKATSRD